jgi:hypothetical protein
VDKGRKSMAKEKVAGGGGLMLPMDNTAQEERAIITDSSGRVVDRYGPVPVLSGPTRGLLEALLAAQAEFPVVVADEEVDAGRFRYKFAPLEKISNAIGPVLRKHGLLVTWETSCSVEGGVFIVAVASILWHPASGGSLHCDLAHSESGVNIQDEGKAIAYLSRYGYKAVVGLVIAREDDDAASVGQKPARNGKAVATISDEQAQALLAKLNENDLDVGALKAHYGLKPGDDIGALPAALYERAMKAVDAAIAKKGGGS